MMSFNVLQDSPSPVGKMESNVIFDQKVIIGFAPVLTYAACEWFLIFLMFIDALLSYLLVWFARYCRLQMPCFLCSKLLHPLHWRLLLCRNHRSEVSSYMSCHNHDNNLADCRRMCDDCLLSFTKMTGPHPDMNRLLLGKLGYDLLSKSHFAHPTSCSCCNKPWRTRHHTQRLIRLGSRGRNSPNKPNIPAPRHLTRRGSGGSLKKMRDHRAETSGGEYVDVGSRSDGMAHVGYTELKIHSDSESDFLFSDDDAFLRMTDFNVEPSERRVHKSRSRKSFEDKKMSNRKQQDNKDKNIRVEDYKKVGSSMRERKLVSKTLQQQPVVAGGHAATLFELISMSEARPFSLGLPREDNASQNENETETSGNSSPSGGEYLSPKENAASREIQIQEHDDSADFVQNISDSAVKIEASDAAMEQKVSVHLPGSVADEPSSDEEDGATGDFKPLASNDMSDSLAREQSSVEETEVNGNNVAEEYFSNEEEDEANAHSEPSTSKHVSGSAEEQSSEDEDGSSGYSVAKSHSSHELESHSSHEVEDVENGDSEPLISKDVSGSAEEQSSEDEDGSSGYSVAKSHSSHEVEDVENGDSEPLISKDVSGLAEEQFSEEEDGSSGYSVAKSHSSHEVEAVDNGDTELSTSKDVSGSAEEQSSDDEDGNNGYSVAKSHSSHEVEDVDNGDTELSTSKDVSGSAEEQSSDDEDGSNGYSVAKSHSSHEVEAVDNGDSERSTAKDVSGSAEEQFSEEEDGSTGYLVVKSHSSHEVSEPLISNNATGSATEEHSGKEEHGDDHEETEPLMSPKLSNEEPSLEHSDKDSSKVTEAQNTSHGPPDLKHSASVESFVSISSDIEGESLVALLKQQLEHDRKCLKDLSKELEEERNATAIATNQAMAMITRLQEEKAALHMEALQYLRMMDEQAEHDVDALEKANDVLADREKEIQDLEMELEYYRVKYPDEPREEILASMGILDNIETSGNSSTDENSEKVPTDTKLTGSPSAGI